MFIDTMIRIIEKRVYGHSACLNMLIMIIWMLIKFLLSFSFPSTHPAISNWRHLWLDSIARNTGFDSQDWWPGQLGGQARAGEGYIC